MHSILIAVLLATASHQFFDESVPGLQCSDGEYNYCEEMQQFYEIQNSQEDYNHELEMIWDYFDKA